MSDAGRVAAVAGRLGCTEGQLYTMVIGLAVALLLAVPGIPAVLRDRPAGGTAGALRPFDDGSTPETAPAPAVPPTTAAALGPPRDGRAPARPAPPARVVPPPSSGGAVATPPPGTVSTFAAVWPPGAPGGLAVAADGTVFVTTDNGRARGLPGPSHVFAFGTDGRLTADHVVAGQRADRPGGLTGAAVHPGGAAVAVLDPDGARVLAVDGASGAQSVLAEVPDLPACLVPVGLCQPGIVDHPPSPVAAAYVGQDLLVTDPAQDTVWRLRPGREALEVWFQSPFVAAGDGPFGMAVDGASVLLTVGTTADLSALGGGALYRVPVEAGGAAGEPALVRAFAEGDRPGAVAVGRSGTAYVVLRDRGAVASVARDGSESGRLDPPGTGPVPLDSPAAVALVPGGLLVANGRTSADPARWAILRVAVDDGPVAGRLA